MSSSALLTSVRRLRGVLAVQQGQERKDEQLLHDFTTHRDDSAFAVLVRRHGPMVLGVCRRVLGHQQDAEDAFQATFLVLAQRAASLRDPRALASFLYGTAFHLASKAKRAAGRRRKHEGSRGVLAQSGSPVDPTAELSWREVRVLLDEEVARLPEKYRSVFVLCYLEELSQAEAGRRLGLKEGTVANRLVQARKLLAQRLAHRGVELTAVLATSAVAIQQASALPAGLMAKTTKAALAAASGKELGGIVSASVVELVQGATAMIGGKTKIAAVLVLTASMLAGAGMWVSAKPQAMSGEQQNLSPPVIAQTGGLSPRPSPEAAKGQEIYGRVLDPEGKPVKDAHLHWPLYHKDLPNPEDRFEMTELGRSDEEGRFRITLPSGEELGDSLRNLAVTAAGYGFNWVEVPKAKTSGEWMVQLRKDLTIRGRIVSLEGRPLPGVKVRVRYLEDMPRGRLDEYLAFWEQDWMKTWALKSRTLMIPFKQSILPPAVTDQNGCFQFPGVGSERIVHLEIRGQGIANANPWIIARPGFDPSAVNKSVRERGGMMGLRIAGQPPVLYGPSFDYVASPSRIVEGVAREAGSGKPVPGVHINGSAGYGFDSTAVTDKEGRYRLEGLPKVKQYPVLEAQPALDSAWLPAVHQSKEAEDGLQPVRVDFTLGRGLVIKGRVIDRTTGKGVASSIMFDYLPDNKFIGKPGYEISRRNYDTDADGRFRIKVVPGTGVLMAYASGAVDPFKPAQFDAEDRKHVTLSADGELITFGGGIGFLKMQNAAKWMNLAADAGVVEQDLYLERGATAKVRIQDPEGKPLSGVIVSGIDGIAARHSHNAYVSPESECTIVALDPDHPRQVIFYHAQRRLAGSLVVRGDEKEPLTVRLAPTGIVAGRVWNADGQPLQGAEIEIHANGPSSPASLLYLYLNLNQTRLPARTDREGRFRLEGVVPDRKFSVSIRRRNAYLDSGSRTKQLQVKAGETLDLGDVRINR